MPLNLPTAVIENFIFSDLTPDTASMQIAVTANLNQFFAEETTQERLKCL